MSWLGFFAFIAALALVLVFGEIVAYFSSHFRVRIYKKFENSSEAAVESQFPLPDSRPSEKLQEQLSRLKALTSATHSDANSRQNAYHASVARFAAYFVLTFGATLLGIVAHGSGNARDVAIEFALQVGDWVEVLAAIFIIFAFRAGVVSRPRWIAARVRAELHRSIMLLCLLLRDREGGPQVRSVDFLFRDYDELVARHVLDGAPSLLIARVRDFWRSQRKKFTEMALSSDRLTSDEMAFYLRHRVRRQIEWFIDSKARLRYIAERRADLVLLLFGIATSLIFARQGVFLTAGYSHGALGVLALLATGVSASVTSYYFSQGTRSLIHRYDIQERYVRGWLENYCAHESSRSVKCNSLERKMAAQQILVFEDLMIDELCDWVRVTSHDTIELG